MPDVPDQPRGVPDRTFDNREAFPRDVDQGEERRPRHEKAGRSPDRRRAVDAPDAPPPAPNPIDRT
ncbi:MAG: hypothetical protein Q8S29_15270 [Phreatobacter sp.]|nr:hypothetical protein [Phreatobacter sp.]